MAKNVRCVVSADVLPLALTHILKIVAPATCFASLVSFCVPEIAVESRICTNWILLDGSGLSPDAFSDHAGAVSSNSRIRMAMTDRSRLSPRFRERPRTGRRVRADRHPRRALP